MESLARTVVLLVLFTTIAGGLMGAGLRLAASNFFKIPRAGSILIGIVIGGVIGFFLLPLIGRLS